jgi:hypothetical protein
MLSSFDDSVPAAWCGTGKLGREIIEIEASVILAEVTPRKPHQRAAGGLAAINNIEKMLFAMGPQAASEAETSPDSDVETARR